MAYVTVYLTGLFSLNIIIYELQFSSREYKFAGSFLNQLDLTDHLKHKKILFCNVSELEKNRPITSHFRAELSYTIDTQHSHLPVRSNGAVPQKLPGELPFPSESSKCTAIEMCTHVVIRPIGHTSAKVHHCSDHHSLQLPAPLEGRPGPG